MSNKIGFEVKMMDDNGRTIAVQPFDSAEECGAFIYGVMLSGINAVSDVADAQTEAVTPDGDRQVLEEFSLSARQARIEYSQSLRNKGVDEKTIQKKMSASKVTLDPANKDRYQMTIHSCRALHPIKLWAGTMPNLLAMARVVAHIYGADWIAPSADGRDRIVLTDTMNDENKPLEFSLEDDGDEG